MSLNRAQQILWQTTCREQLLTSVQEGDVTADLVVVGGGFSGCSAALKAAELGLNVCVLEAERIGLGGSGRNVGLVNAGLWMPPDDVERTMGREAGEKLNAALAGAPDLVFSLIDKHRIDCEAVRNGTLHCAHSAAGLRDIKSRYRQLESRGAPVTLLDPLDTAARTGSSRFQGALHDARAGTIQPLAYCTGLARAAQQAGANIHTNSPATHIERQGDQWLAHTARGTVTAKYLLVATNAYHVEAQGVPAPAFVPVHYFQVATVPLDDENRAAILPELEGGWDTATVMSSFRRDQNGRLIIGAVGSLDHSAASIHRDWARSKLSQLFPHLKDIPLEYVWCGRIAMTSDHIPKIVRLGANAHMIYGYSGRGIGPGTLFGSRVVSAFATGNEELLPIKPVDRHEERHVTLKAAYYETGACLAHLVRF
ncbi:NAD(P)/FAD-dependent oxidoreductase [Hoeflea sp. TYP-13]|uniref:NAD(P)/FAD-dependent oxidoreductase n=1 Tax=Hoeflea sp. TYP-13 TaxID=3230023 RepID=UPI0034C65F47